MDLRRVLAQIFKIKLNFLHRHGVNSDPTLPKDIILDDENWIYECELTNYQKQTEHQKITLTVLKNRSTGDNA